MIVNGFKVFKRKSIKMITPVESNCLLGVRDGSAVIFGALDGDPELILFDQ